MWFPTCLRKVNDTNFLEVKFALEVPCRPRAYQSLTSWNIWNSLRTVGKGLNKIGTVRIPKEQTTNLILLRLSKQSNGFSEVQQILGGPMPPPNQQKPPSKLKNHWLHYGILRCIPVGCSMWTWNSN